MAEGHHWAALGAAVVAKGHPWAALGAAVGAQGHHWAALGAAVVAEGHHWAALGAAVLSVFAYSNTQCTAVCFPGDNLVGLVTRLRPRALAPELVYPPREPSRRYASMAQKEPIGASVCAVRDCNSYV